MERNGTQWDGGKNFRLRKRLRDLSGGKTLGNRLVMVTQVDMPAPWRGRGRMTKAETQGDPTAATRRVYPLDARDLTEEQIAVAFAMTSRRPEPFDEIARQVSEEKAADFHERWVLGYGHASVAEHAVVHLAVENVSRLACDGLEDNRLASYTEKSSRYQVIPPGDFYFPRELDVEPELAARYNEACRGLFATYREIIDRSIDHLRRVHPQRERETGLCLQPETAAHRHR